jgi:hypothetical protein
MLGQSLFAWREEKEKKETAEVEEAYQPYKRYVEKQMLPVVICTSSYRVEGMMHITYHHRALDVLNGPESFVPITSARIYNAATNELVAELDFIAITKRQIVLFYEAGEPLPPPHKRAAGEAEGAEASSDRAGKGATESDASPERSDAH